MFLKKYYYIRLQIYTFIKTNSRVFSKTPYTVVHPTHTSTDDLILTRQPIPTLDFKTSGHRPDLYLIEGEAPAQELPTK